MKGCFILKKLVSLFFTLLLFITSSSTANAAEGVSLSKVKTIDEYSYFNGVVKTNAAGTQVLLSAKDQTKANIIDLTTGESLKDFTGVSMDFVMNDAQSYYAYTMGEEDQIVFKKDSTITKTTIYGEAIGFLSNSNILIVAGNTQNSTTEEIIAYDVEKNQMVFTAVLPEDCKKIVVGMDLAVVSTTSIDIYNQAGAKKKNLQFKSDLTTVAYAEDDMSLLVATKKESLAVYSTSNYVALSRTFLDSTGAKEVFLDASNKYLALANAASEFRIYDFKTGDRIYTTLDDTRLGTPTQLVLSNGGKYILFNHTIYNGSSLNIYAKSMSLPTKYKTMQLGESYAANVTVKYSNNKTATVSKGVEWDSSNLEVASINNNVLKARKLGSFTLKASYLGFKAEQKVKTVDTKAPELKGVKNITVYSKDKATKLQGITAMDVGEGNLTSKIKVSGTYNANKAGKYKLTYSVKDSSNNTTKKTRTITVLYNPIQSMYFSKEDNTLLPVKLLMTTDELKSQAVIGTFVQISPKLKNRLVMQVPTSKKLIFKDLTIRANGKTLNIKTTGSIFVQAHKKEMVFKDLTTAQRNWLKKNINLNKKVVFTIHTKNKTINKTLTKKQKQGVLDGVLTYDYVKYKYQQ